MENRQYWIVVSDSRGPALHPVRHQSEAAAVQEASRLAKLNPGHRFTVFASVCAVQRTDVQITPLRPDFLFDDEIPF